MALKLDNHPSMQVTVIPILLEVSNQGELQDNVFVFTGKISYCSGVTANMHVRCTHLRNELTTFSCTTAAGASIDRLNPVKAGHKRLMLYNQQNKELSGPSSQDPATGEGPNRKGLELSLKLPQKPPHIITRTGGLAD